MSDTTKTLDLDATVHPVNVDVTPALTERNRLTSAFRPILAIPHILLVGGPAAFAISSGFRGQNGSGIEWGAGTGVLGAVAAVVALIARDEYPPFGDDAYPAGLVLTPLDKPRNRLTVGSRLVLAIPQMIVVAILSVGWAIATIIAWLSILLTGNFPRSLYRFGVGVLRWSTRVEAYLLLLHDEYPPFSLEAR